MTLMPSWAGSATSGGRPATCGISSVSTLVLERGRGDERVVHRAAGDPETRKVREERLLFRSGESDESATERMKEQPGGIGGRDASGQGQTGQHRVRLECHVRRDSRRRVEDRPGQLVLGVVEQQAGYGDAGVDRIHRRWRSTRSRTTSQSSGATSGPRWATR